jgi:hypothetical protein
MKNKQRFYFNLRKIHRVIAPYFLVFLLIIAITGILLGSKKIFYQSVYKAPASKQITKQQEDRLDSLPVEQMKREAISFLENYDASCAHQKIEKIEIRLAKHQINYVFKNGYVVMFSLSDYQLKEINKNTFPQLIHIHDGSIVEEWLSKFPFKQWYTIVIGLALLVFTMTGFFLWYQYKFIIKK